MQIHSLSLSQWFVLFTYLHISMNIVSTISLCLICRLNSDCNLSIWLWSLSDYVLNRLSFTFLLLCCEDLQNAPFFYILFCLSDQIWTISVLLTFAWIGIIVIWYLNTRIHRQSIALTFPPICIQIQYFANDPTLMQM